jgi:flagellar motor component MotA
MSGLWLVSYVVLWLVVMGGALAFFAMAREMETLHKKLDTLQKFFQGQPPEEKP